MMDISKEVHGAKNDLMAAICGLDNFADEETKKRGRDAIMQVSDKLTEIEKHVKELQGHKP